MRRRPVLRFRLALVPLGAAALLGPGAAVAAALSAPLVRGPTGPVATPPSFTVVADPTDGKAAMLVAYCLAPCEDPAAVRVLSGPSPLTTGPLPPDEQPLDGDYFVVASATDGTTTGPATTVTFTLDRTAPGPPTLTAGPAAFTNGSTPAFAWSGDPSEGVSHHWQITSGADPADPEATVVQSGDVTAPTATAKPLKDGVYAFQVRSTDAVGNRGPLSAPAVFTVDTAPPAAPQVTSAPPGPDQLTPTFTWATGAPAGADTFRWEILAGDVTVQGPTPVTELSATPGAPLIPGAYAFRLVEIDPAGNVSEPATLSFTISLSRPAPANVTGLVLTPGIGQIGLTWSLADGVGVVALRVVRRADGSPTGPGDPLATVTELAPDARSYVDVGLTGDTRYFYALYARDAAGTFSPVAATGNVLAQAPVAATQTTPTPPGPATPPTDTPSTGTGQRPATLNPRRMLPTAGATLRVMRPLLRWRGRPGGVVLYNLQIFDAQGRKLLKAFPRTERYQVPRGVLKPGKRYFWRVWPWFGPARKFSRQPLGISYFQVSRPRPAVSASRRSPR
jgi:hypothetical protein